MCHLGFLNFFNWLSKHFCQFYFKIFLIKFYQTFTDKNSCILAPPLFCFLFFVLTLLKTKRDSDEKYCS